MLDKEYGRDIARQWDSSEFRVRYGGFDSDCEMHLFEKEYKGIEPRFVAIWCTDSEIEDGGIHEMIRRNVTRV